MKASRANSGGCSPFNTAIQASRAARCCCPQSCGQLWSKHSAAVRVDPITLALAPRPRSRRTGLLKNFSGSERATRSSKNRPDQIGISVGLLEIFRVIGSECRAPNRNRHSKMTYLGPDCPKADEDWTTRSPGSSATAPRAGSVPASRTTRV
jgi:hypothetical protein